MTDTLYQYYEEELQFMRHEGQAFARRHPTAAGHLQLEATRSADPHVERLIESFSFLTARIQKKLDDDFPEITDALLNVLYPHYLAPIPSLAMLELVPQPANVQATGLEVPRGSRLHTNKVGDVACQFRTCYPVTLWPLELVEAAPLEPPYPATVVPPAGAQSAIRLRLRCQADFKFDQLTLQSLRFHLNGDSRVAYALYELLFNHAVEVELRSADPGTECKSVRLDPAECLSPVGFAAEEALVPFTDQSFAGYRLLTELFSFPEKFLFFDLAGMDQAAAQSMGRTVDVIIYLNAPLTGLEHAISKGTFRLGCTPVVNLFERVSEPVRLTHRKPKYRVAADHRRPLAYEVYSVDEVSTADALNPTVYRKFYDYRHASPWAPSNEEGAFYYASRTESHRPGDHGTDMYLHPVDLNFNPAVHGEKTLVVRTTCTNRDLPVQLQHAGERLRFELEAAVPLQRINCLRTPTTPLRPPQRRHAQWRLISHLALNHLSFSSAANSQCALQEMLRLYDFSDARNSQHLAAVNRQWIEGITAVRSQRITRRMGSTMDGGICRGIEIAVDLDEEKFGSSAFLFATVLERFLALYASLNSFVELVANTGGSEAVLKRWPPRAGEMPLL